MAGVDLHFRHESELPVCRTRVTAVQGEAASHYTNDAGNWVRCNSFTKSPGCIWTYFAQVVSDENISCLGIMLSVSSPMLRKSEQKVGQFKISMVPFWPWRKWEFYACNVVKCCSSEIFLFSQFQCCRARDQLLCEQWWSKCPRWQTLTCKLLISQSLSSFVRVQFHFLSLQLIDGAVSCLLQILCNFCQLIYEELLSKVKSFSLMTIIYYILYITDNYINSCTRQRQRVDLLPEVTFM